MWLNCHFATVLELFRVREGNGMQKVGLAMYDAANNRLQVVRPGESITRYIPCMNLRPQSDKVFGVQVNGDEIYVLVGPHRNSRPNKKILYNFSSLSGGSSSSY
jgi:hypothetical protein